MREALSLLDFEDESISDVRALLVRAAFAPTFLKANEGRRFLSYLFTLQVCPLILLLRAIGGHCHDLAGQSAYQSKASHSRILHGLLVRAAFAPTFLMAAS